MHVDLARADRLLRQLADLLRASLRSDQEELTTFANELEILRLYAHIMQQRFEDRVTLSWSIDANIDRALLPTMLLQPLLENAFKHGVERTSARAHIEVEARRTDDQLDIRIRNSGAISAIPGEGVGLRNSQARLRAHYGERATFTFSADESRAEVRILLPWQERAA
jgi:sensor histidine kinase YesM